MNIAKTVADRSWRSLWPADIAEAPENAILPDVPWKGQISRNRRIFQAMLGVGGSHCGVAEVQDLVRKMEDWSQRHAGYFSWPSTVDGWNRAVWATMSEPQGKEDLAWLWAGYGPSLQVALSEKPSPHSWAVSLLRALPDEATASVAPAAPAQAAPAAPVEPSRPEAAPSAPAQPRRTPAARKERELSPDVLETRQWLVSQLSAISSSKEPEGILQERFDQAIKERVVIEGRPGPRMQAGWIEYRLLPAVAGLDAQSINLLVDFWPHSHSRPLIDAMKTLSAPRFWMLIEDAPNQSARAAYVEKFLPTVIDASEWSSSLRYQLGATMLEWTAKRPEAFEERLGLWRAWGGRLDDAEAVPASEGSVFTKAFQPAETMEQWIAAKANPLWDKVVAAAAPQNKSRRGLP